MIGRRVLVRRYALALAELAAERNQLDAVEAALMEVARAVREDDGVRRLWLEGRGDAAQKVDRLRRALGGALHPLVSGFLGVVASKGREGMLLEMVEQFQAEADRLRQVVHVELECAAALSAQEQQMLAERLRERLGARGVRLSVRVNPELIGGFVVRAGDLRVDGSLSRQLSRLHEALRTAPLPASVSVDGRAG